jgi:hypothetical protein
MRQVRLRRMVRYPKGFADAEKELAIMPGSTLMTELVVVNELESAPRKKPIWLIN